MGKTELDNGEALTSSAPASGPLWRRLARFRREFFAEPLRRVDQESRAYLASDASRHADLKVMVVLVTVALSLTLQAYLGGSFGMVRAGRLLQRVGLERAGGSLLAAATDWEDAQLNSLTYWSAGCFVTYLIIPSLVIRLVFRERVRDYGLKLRGVMMDGWVYAVMFGIMVPLVLLASADGHFQATYPFYRLSPAQPLGPKFLRWELQYALQFFALEFFFRGFLLHGTRLRFGIYSIFVMMVPYCMIHFAKPMPEALASIVAGIALGFMSLKTRSIWMGTAIHVSVAWSMDLASLWRQGLFP
jgi:membrane protease YdiL (CAAX protease family)